MQNNRVWERACGLKRTVVEGVRYDETSEAIVVSARPDSRARNRCGRCGRRSPGYDGGDGRRRWRALDAGTTRVFIEADAPRVQCRTHGQTVAQVPWARHGVGHTRDFDAMAAWLAVRTSKSATCQLLGVAWRTIGSIITRVNTDIEATVDRLEGLRRIGIDEISYKRGHRYLIVVVDHDTGRLVWAGPGRSQAALDVFFDELGMERAAEITHVSADMADWIAKTVARRAPNAIRCADPFHVVAWAIEALDTERRRAWNQAKGRKIKASPGRRGRTTGNSRRIARSRYALWKNPGRPQPPATTAAQLDSQNRPPTVAGISPQRRTPLRVQGQRRRRQTSTRPVAGLGPPITTPRLRPPRQEGDETSRSDRRQPRTRPQPRTHRIHQHQDPTNHPHRLRIPWPPTPHRPRTPRPRQPPTPTPRPTLTHGYDRRARYVRLVVRRVGGV